jgi:hypothetical protein
MNIVIFDSSRGKAYKKTKRVFASLLVEISKRYYVGTLPSRVIKELLNNLTKKVSRLSDIIVLVEQIDGFHGWTGYHFGRSVSKIRYENFLKANKYIINV